MMRTDSRLLTHDYLLELLRRGVVAVQQGGSPETVFRALGIGRATMCHWLSLYRQCGWVALDARKRGGRKPKLSAR